MSYLQANEALCRQREGRIALLIEPRVADLGDFSVRRVLPSRLRRMVGPFAFLDHMGPAAFPPGQGIAVRPHPHIGIATITYLFEGEILHRDSLGVVQPIQPGAVNLMTAGRGIVHSERAGADLQTTSRLHGIQAWIALPEDQQERAPAFSHYPAGDLPVLDRAGCTVRLILGEAYGAVSPVTTYSRTLYMDCALAQGATLRLPADAAELALYVVEGQVDVEGEACGAGMMAVACPRTAIAMTAREASRVMVIGGDALGRRAMVWNFVHSDPARIERAVDDWREGRFPRVPGDDEFVPLPDRH